MILKNLTIAAAFVLISGLGASPALAQDTPPAEPTMAAPGRRTGELLRADGTMAPAPAGSGPRPRPVKLRPRLRAAPRNPYGLLHIVKPR